MMVTRLHRRLLGVLGEVRRPGEFTQILVYRSARRRLSQLLSANGRWQSGLLFGIVHDDILHVRYAVPDGYPGWESDIFRFDPRYALGWADALNQDSDVPQMDWVGNWVACPDSRMPDMVECELLLHHASAQCLVDDHHFLMPVGNIDGKLMAHAMRGLDESVEYIPVQFQIP